jgi:hypothetical protein
MSMSQQTAERWVTISAVTVAGVYVYRRMTEPTSQPATLPKLLGIGELPALGAWATAWGFTFLVVAVMAEASPGLGGGFAILIMTADLMTNASSIFGDVSKQQKSKASASVASASGLTTVSAPTRAGTAAGKAKVYVPPINPAGTPPAILSPFGPLG